MRRVALVVVISAAAHAFAFRAATGASFGFWAILVGVNALLAGFAVYTMYDDGTLLDRLKPRWGDLSIGALTAAALLLGSFGIRQALAPAQSPRSAWLYRFYLQVGDDAAFERSLLLSAMLVLFAVFEELAWRGLVLGDLTERLGTRRAWPMAALLYAVAYLPSMFLLADPNAGPNPLVVMAALGTGLVWSFTASLLGRLPPVMFSHAAFAYFSIVVFR